MALTKISRGLLDTGISDSSDATAITISSDENVGIGGTPVSTFSGYDGAALHIQQSGTGSSVGSQVRLSSGSSGHAAGDGSYMAHWGDSNLYIANQENANILFYTNGSERLRINADGEVAVGVTSVGTSILSYDRDVGAPNWGLNITENTTFNDNSGHTFTSKNSTHGVIYIKDEGGNNGFTAIPFYPNAGGGIGFAWNALDPDAGTWQTSGTVTFTMAGTSGLAFTVAFAAGSGTITITRTSGSQLYRVVFSEFAQM